MTPYPEGFRRETMVGIGAVERALELARRSVGSKDIASKGTRDLVTATDVAVEDAVRDILHDALGVPVIGEERGGEASADGSPYWLVDPICGTRNYASGIPLYCVNLALVEGDQVTVAVIEDGKSKGARREHAARFTAAAIRADRWDFRSLGTTLALPYLAAGRVSAYVVFWVSAIHAGAGSLLVTEAGGTLSDVDGHPWTIHSDSLVAGATPDLHRELLDLMQ